MWKVELRDNCKICGNPLPNSRYRTFCSAKCRNKAHNQKQNSSGYYKAWKIKHKLSPCNADSVKV